MATINNRWAINHALDEEMARNDKVFLMGEDIGASGGPFGATRGLFDKYGEWRVRDCPISEEGFTGAAVGAAIVGYRPVVEIMFMDFMTIAIEQLANQAAKTFYVSGGKIKVPMVVRTLSGGGFRAGAHHSQSLESWFAHVPGLKVAYPSNPYDMKGLLKAAIRDDNPVLFLEHKSLMGIKGDVPDEDYTVPFGKGEVKLEGDDVTIVTYGRMVYTALKAAEALATDGIKAEVIDLRTLQPWDKELVKASVQKTNRLLVLYEAPQDGGFGAEVASVIAEECIYDLDAPIKRLGAAFSSIPVGTVEDFLYPNEEDVVTTVKSMIS